MTLLFRKRYVEQILSGEKTATRRASRPMVKVGGTYRIRLNFFEYIEDRILVERLYEQSLGHMTESDAAREGASSLDEFREQWTELYGPWDGDREVWVLDFRHLLP
jgi:hypothetical protein